MKYKNTQKAIIILGGKESVPPFGITRDYTEDDLKSSHEIRAAIDKKYLIPFDGSVPADTPTISSPRAQEWTQAPESTQGKTVKKPTSDGKGIVEYIVAEGEGCDGLGAADGVVTALPQGGNRSVDHIEHGLDASKYKNASEAMDAEFDKESAEASFDDDDVLAEKEEDRLTIPDADQEIIKDMSQVLVNRGKDGSELKTIPAIIQESTNRAITELEQATRPDYDEGEDTNAANGKIVDFLSQPFSAKKWAVAKEMDSKFLGEIKRVTKSDNLRSLVDQRLSELGK